MIYDVYHLQKLQTPNPNPAPCCSLLQIAKNKMAAGRGNVSPSAPQKLSTQDTRPEEEAKGATSAQRLGH